MDGTVSNRTDTSVPLSADADAPLLTLIADSGIHVLVREVCRDRLAAVTRRFLVTEEDGAPALHLASLDGDGYLYHPLSGEPVAHAATTAFDGARAAERFAGEWLPLPYLRRSTEAGSAPFDAGPGNWVRILLSPIEPDGETTGWRLVIAFDTALAAGGPSADSIDAAPRNADVSASSRFGFAAAIDDVADFVSEAWVDDWMRQLCSGGNRRPGPDVDHGSVSPADELRDLDHLALYLTLLAALADLEELPDVVLLPAGDGVRGLETVPVDLVLDIGLLETTALLVEPTGAAGVESVGRVTPLTLCDFSQPWQRHSSPFSSRFELARTTFGSEALSRWSGRIDAFNWPSVGRLGGEAERLACTAAVDEAVTGIATPALYIWDEEPTAAVWRMASDGQGRRGAMLSGPLLALLDANGLPIGAETGKPAATKPRFPRGALLTLALVELVLQATVAANGPSYRADGIRPMAARRVRRVLLSLPTALTEADRAIVQQRADAAISIVWRAMGWNGRRDLDRPPTVSLVHERATNVQIAHLWREISGRFQARARDYLDLMGKLRPGHGGARSLRIASLDVGDSTSGVAVVTWEMVEPAALLGTHQLLAGLPVGSDALQHAVSEQVVVPALLAHAESVSGSEGADLLRNILAPASKADRRARHCGRRLARDLLLPVARGLLEEHRRADRHRIDTRVVRSIGDLLGVGRAAAEAPLTELDASATDAGLEPLGLFDAVIDIPTSRLSETISNVTVPSLAALQKVVRALDCDLLLLTGASSDIPGLREVVLAGMPVRPDRVVTLDDHHRRRTTASVRARSCDDTSAACSGLLIAARPLPRIGGLTLVVRPPDARVVEQRIGPVDHEGMLRKENVVKSQTEGAARRGESPAAPSVVLEADLPVSLHSRRVPLESWPPLPAYALQRSVQRKGKQPRGPFKIALAWRPTADRLHGEPTVLWVRDADGNGLAAGDVVLVRRSLPVGEHWLEGGELTWGPTGEDEHDDV